MKKHNAGYLGSFDPLTNGHLDIISRGSRIFTKLIIGVGGSTKKNLTFSQKERLAMLTRTCKHLNNVEISSFDGLAVDFCKKKNISVIIRGLRTEADYVYEMQMAMMNFTLDPKIDTFFIPTRQDLSHISSSLVKEVAFLGGDVSKLVPEASLELLTSKKNNTNKS